MKTMMSSMTLQQFCRALAAHLLLGHHPELLEGFMAQDTAEKTADFIQRFALGETVSRRSGLPEGSGDT